MEREQLERGLEPWFAYEIGLPNGGLDPSRDCNHINNMQLKNMFGERHKKQGYFYRGAKSDNVRARAEELYPVIWQTAEVPKSRYIPESFARALVSEVCHGYCMNWALYPTERWRGKKKDSQEVVQQKYKYKGTHLEKMYYALAQKRIESEIHCGEGEALALQAARQSENIEVGAPVIVPQYSTNEAQEKCQAKAVAMLRKMLRQSQGLLASQEAKGALLEKCENEELVKENIEEMAELKLEISKLEEQIKSKEEGMKIAKAKNVKE